MLRFLFRLVTLPFRLAFAVVGPASVPAWSSGERRCGSRAGWGACWACGPSSRLVAGVALGLLFAPVPAASCAADSGRCRPPDA